MAYGPLNAASRYDVIIHYQGGVHTYTRVEGVAQLAWGRTLDDYSEASLTVAKTRQAGGPEPASADCCGLLGRVRTWGHEITIYRDGVFVWQGPVVEKSEFADRFEFSARDVFGYLDRRRNPRGYNWAEPDDQNPGGWGPADPQIIVDTLLHDTLAEHDPNLLAHYHSGFPIGVGATYQAVTPRDSVIADGVRDMLDYGIDLFTVGRDLYSLPEGRARSNTPYRLTEPDFLGDLEVREVGMDGATRATAVGSRATAEAGTTPANTLPPVGTYPTPPAGVDEFFGLVERGINARSATTQGAVDNLAHKLWEYAYPPPVTVITPTSTQLSPNAPVGIQDLVPARRFIVAVESYCTRAQVLTILNELSVTVDVTSNSGMTEAVQVSLTSIDNPGLGGGV